MAFGIIRIEGLNSIEVLRLVEVIVICERFSIVKREPDRWKCNSETFKIGVTHLMCLDEKDKISSPSAFCLQNCGMVFVEARLP